MKKKLLNILLSVTLATSMMFSLTACGKTSLDKWAESDEAAQVEEYLDSCYSDLGMSVQVDAEGEVFGITVQFDDVLELTDDDRKAFENYFESNSATFESTRDQLRDELNDENITVSVKYLNGDGAELYSNEF